MKLSILTSILNLTLVAGASAGTINPGYAYDFLSGGKIGYCPGVSARVLSVDVVGATWSGGAHGYEGDFRQSNFPARRDIRADVEGGIRSFDIKAQAWDGSLGSIVANEPALMEQLGVRGAKVAVCVSKLDAVRVNQDRAGGANGTSIQFDVAVKYFVNLDGPAGPASILVQEVEGSKTVTSPFFDLYYDWSPRAQIFMQNSWSGLKTDLGASLAPIANPAADQGMSLVRGYLADYIGSNGQ